MATNRFSVAVLVDARFARLALDTGRSVPQVMPSYGRQFSRAPKRHHVAVVDQREARARLDSALAERAAVREAANRADALLRGAMRDALAAGVTVQEVA